MCLRLPDERIVATDSRLAFSHNGHIFRRILYIFVVVMEYSESGFENS